MKRKMNPFWCLAVITMFAVTSCASRGTTFTSVWKDKDYQGGMIKKVLIIGVSKKPHIKQMFEDEFVKQLRAQGANGVTSYSTIPSDKMLDKATILDAVHSRGIDAVIITKLIDRKDAQDRPSPEHQDLSSQYFRSYNYAHNRGFIMEKDAVSLETNLYDVATEKLIWSALSETFKRGADDEIIKTFIKKVIGNLKKQNLL
jgi:hypothetical protein